MKRNTLAHHVRAMLAPAPPMPQADRETIERLLQSYSLRPASRDRRLITRGAYRVVRNLGAKIGIHLHPHMLRHSAITQAVEKSVGMGLNLDKVRDFSAPQEHRNPDGLPGQHDERAGEPRRSGRRHRTDEN